MSSEHEDGNFSLISSKHILWLNDEEEEKKNKLFIQKYNRICTPCDRLGVVVNLLQPNYQIHHGGISKYLFPWNNNNLIYLGFVLIQFSINLSVFPFRTNKTPSN